MPLPPFSCAAKRSFYPPPKGVITEAKQRNFKKSITGPSPIKMWNIPNETNSQAQSPYTTTHS